MELTKELVDEVVLAANDVEYGRVIISISGPPERLWTSHPTWMHGLKRVLDRRYTAPHGRTQRGCAD